MSALSALLLFSLFSVAFCGIFMSSCDPFRMHIKSIREMKRDKSFMGDNTRFYVNKTGKGVYDTGVFGVMNFTASGKKLTCSMMVEVYDPSTNKWNAYKNDYMDLSPFCKSFVMSKFYKRFRNTKFDGNCDFGPHTCYLDGIDIDKEIHDGIPFGVECGCFKVILNFNEMSEKEPNCIYSLEIVSEVKKREEAPSSGSGSGSHSNAKHQRTKEKKKSRGSREASEIFAQH